MVASPPALHGCDLPFPRLTQLVHLILHPIQTIYQLPLLIAFRQLASQNPLGREEFLHPFQRGHNLLVTAA
jgi:hypothetical protein